MTCNKCNGTGRIPLKSYRHGFINCECQEERSREYPYQYTPDMFDFPCSETFRAFYGNEPVNVNVIDYQKVIVEVERQTDLTPVYAQLQYLKNKLPQTPKSNQTDRI